jgi:hypothetical protein
VKASPALGASIALGVFSRVRLSQFSQSAVEMAWTTLQSSGIAPFMGEKGTSFDTLGLA